jgi:putative endonuclease
MKFFVYKLHSDTIDKYYIGQTEDIENRLLQHNSSSNENWTQKGKPWRLCLSLVCSNRLLEIRIERFIKKQKSRVFIEKLIKDKNMQEEIIKKHDC